MWSELKSGLVVLSKGDNIKADNVLIVEEDNHYVMIGLDKIPNRKCGWSESHPLKELIIHAEKKKLKIRMIVDGKETDDRLCVICRNKFKGFTGTCSIGQFYDYDEACLPDIDANKSLLMTDGTKVQSRYLDKGYYYYRRGAELADFCFTTEVVENNCEEIINHHGQYDSVPTLESKDIEQLYYSGGSCYYGDKECKITLILSKERAMINCGGELSIVPLTDVTNISPRVSNYYYHSIGNRLADMYMHLIKQIDLKTMEMSGVGKIVSVWAESKSIKVEVETPKLSYISVFKSKKQIDTICGLARGLTSRVKSDTL